MSAHEQGLRRVAVVAALVAAGALVIAGVVGWGTHSFRGGWAGGEKTTINEHRSFPAAGVNQLRIGAVAEPIRITRSAGDSIEVSFTGTVSAANRELVPRLAAALSGGTLDVRIERPRTVGLDYYSQDLQLAVAVPPAFARDLEARTVSGALSAADLDLSAFDASTTSGTILVEKVKADTISLHSVSGSVKAEKVDGGSISAETTSGAVGMAAVAEQLRIHTVSGAINASSDPLPKRTEAQSTSGEVRLTFPPDSKFAIDAHSTSGGIQCAFPILMSGVTGTARNELVGNVGESANSVQIRTVSGGISLLHF